MLRISIRRRPEKEARRMDGLRKRQGAVRHLDSTARIGRVETAVPTHLAHPGLEQDYRLH